MSDRKLAPCGTHAAYRRHLRWGEKPCEPCMQASRDTNKKYRPQYNEKKRQLRRLEGKAQRAPKTTRNPEPPLVMPEVVQGPDGVGPCAVPENGYLWDSIGDGESPGNVYRRHRIAKEICLTACPVYERCRSEPPQGAGVVAGVVIPMYPTRKSQKMRNR